jgi:cell division cycle 2-like
VNFARSWGFASIRSVPGASCSRLMAAARHGGHRGRDIARERELDLERSRRSKEHHHHSRHPSHDRGLERRSDGGRSRGRELSHGYSRHRLPPRSWPSGRVKDMEPGELSSGSGSEESCGRSLKAREQVENDVVGVCRYDRALSPCRKRRHSPVQDGNASKLQATYSVRSRRELHTVATGLPQPLPPPMSDMNTVAAAGECSPMNLDMSVCLHEAEGLLDHDNDKVMEGGEEYPMMRNIFTSRWANAEEEEEVVVPQKKKSASPANSFEKRSAKRATSLESGELLGMSVGNSSISPNSMLVQGSENEDLEVDRDNCMDVAMERDIDFRADYLLDIDVENNARGSRTPENVQVPHRCFNMLQSCRSIDEFERLNTINEGTYGVVFRVRDKKTGEVVALKKVKMDKERDREGFPLTALREINILLSLHHPSIVDVKEVIVGGPDNDTFMVMEYMEHDLKGVMEAMKQPYHQSEVKCLMHQLLEGVKYLHDNWVLHR